MTGYYVSNPNNFLTPEQALFRNWYLSNVPAAPFSTDSYRYAGNVIANHVPLTPISSYFKVSANQTYTVGVTRVSGAGTFVLGVYAYYLDDQTPITGLTGATSNTTAGRVSYTFTAPNTARPMGVAIAAQLQSGYSAASPLTLRGATLVFGAGDIGELQPTFVDSTDSGSLDMRLVLYSPNGPRYKVLGAVNDVEVSFALSDVGALKFKYNKTLPEWAILTANECEVAVELTTDGTTWFEPPNGRFYRMSTSDDDTEVVGETDFTFESLATLLRRMTMQTSGSLDAQGNRPFGSTTAGIILKTVFDECHFGSIVTGVTYDFDTSNDSGGQSWGSTFNIEYKPGIDLFSILSNLVEQGLVEWQMNGRTLRVFNADNVSTGLNNDRSSVVVYRAGYEIITAPNKSSNQDRTSLVKIYGDDNVVLALANNGALSAYGHLETTVTQGGVKDTGTMTILGQASLDKGAQVLYQYTRSINWTRASKFPFRDFAPGDYIGTVTKDNTSTPEVNRVRQVTMLYSISAGVQGNLVLNTRFEEAQIKQAKKTNGITRGATLGGNGNPSDPFVPGSDNRQPKKVTNLLGASLPYYDNQGFQRAQITLDWDDVTQATDNTAQDMDRYEIYTRVKNLATPQAWTLYTSIPSATSIVTMSPFPPGIVQQFQVRAMARESQTPGIFSDILDVTTATDITPPPVPTAPILSTRGGAVSITWDGKGVGGVSMPVDFLDIEIQTAEDSAFTTNLRSLGVLTRAGTIAIADLTIGITYFYRFRSEDWNHNFSAYSATSSIVTSNTVDVGVIGRTITNANIVLGTIQEEVISDGAITNPKIKAGSITASRLAVGGTNRIVDPHFVQTSLNTIRRGTANQIPFVTFVSPSGSVDGYCQIAPTTATATEVFLNETSTLLPDRYPIEIIPGESYLFQFKFTRASGTASGGMRIYYLLTDNTTGSVDVVSFTSATTSGTVLSSTWIAPVGVVSARVSFFVSAAISSQQFSNPGVYLKYGATLIEDGAITTNKLTANAVTAAKIAALTITAGEIATNAITADKIVAGAVSAIKIAADAIDGKTITGALIRTTASGARVELANTGIYQFDASNNAVSAWTIGGFNFRSAITGARTTFDITGIKLYDATGTLTSSFDATNGNATITGIFRSNTTFPFVEINNSLWPNDLFGIRFWGQSGFNIQPEVFVARAGLSPSGPIGTIHMRSAEQVSVVGDAAAGHAEIILNPRNGGTYEQWTLQTRQASGPLSSLMYGRGDGSGGFTGGPFTITSAGRFFTKSQADVFHDFSTNFSIRWWDWSSGGQSFEIMRLDPGEGANAGAIHMYRWLDLSSVPTTTGAPNMARITGNYVGISTSLSRYKKNQMVIPIRWQFLDLVPKSWNDSVELENFGGDATKTRRYAGFIAEEVKAISDANNGIFHSLLSYDKDGNLQGLQYERFIVHVIPILKNLVQRVTALEGAL